MARSEKQKLKLLYLIRMLNNDTDLEHGLTLGEIREKLETEGITAERKSICSDIECLKEFGYDIESEKTGRGYRYALTGRMFETAELKLLVDAIQSARFITERKSRELIRKLELLTSRYDAARLNRQVYVNSRIKSMNESIFYNVDGIHEAISDNHKITFNYYSWTLNKKLAPRRGGELYKVSPWGLCWDNDYYYLVGYDDGAGKVKHYRVDKMAHITEISEDREGSDELKKFNMAEYSSRMFGMWGGKEEYVTLTCVNDMIGVILDRFGKGVSIIRVDDGHFRVKVRVALSAQFIGWIIALGDGISITAPCEAVRIMKETAERLQKQYL